MAISERAAQMLLRLSEVTSRPDLPGTVGELIVTPTARRLLWARCLTPGGHVLFPLVAQTEPGEGLTQQSTQGLGVRPRHHALWLLRGKAAS